MISLVWKNAIFVGLSSVNAHPITNESFLFSHHFTVRCHRMILNRSCSCLDDSACSIQSSKKTLKS
jgi:hypothetical protein